MKTEEPAAYEWIRWLSGPDAALLLLVLCQHIDDSRVTRTALQDVIAQWRANAHKALAAEDWTASVDGYLEVKVDARLYVFSQVVTRQAGGGRVTRGRAPHRQNSS